MLAQPGILPLMHLMELAPIGLGMAEFPQSGCPSLDQASEAQVGVLPHQAQYGPLNFKGPRGIAGTAWRILSFTCVLTGLEGLIVLRIEWQAGMLSFLVGSGQLPWPHKQAKLDALRLQPSVK